jgi:hypothetical protein
MGGMDDTDLLSLSQAAAATGYARHDLREMLRLGRLYGLRIDGHWRIGPSDLARLPAQSPTCAVGDTAALLTAIHERDRLIRQLQDERLALATRIGHLQAQLTENEARLAVIHAEQHTLPLEQPEPPPISSALPAWNLCATEEPGTGRPRREVPAEPATPLTLVHRGSASPTQRLIGRLSGLARLFRLT